MANVDQRMAWTTFHDLKMELSHFQCKSARVIFSKVLNATSFICTMFFLGFVHMLDSPFIEDLVQHLCNQP